MRLKWHTHAGGTTSRKHGYTAYPPEGSYYVDPISSRHGVHMYYIARFANDKGKLRDGRGLWRDIGKFSHPNSAKGACQNHYDEHFRHVTQRKKK